MLVLTRKVGEAIVIGEGIEIVVAAVRGQQVKIGISAPSTMHILREELRDVPTTPRTGRLPGVAGENEREQSGDTHQSR